MPSETATQSGLTWLSFALMTVACWGLYGSFLHAGKLGMRDPGSGGFKAFLFVGIAYFLTAVLAPAFMLWVKGAAWTFPAKGWLWSLLAGTVGAVGAFCVLLAFGAEGQPSVVMAIIFAGAPIVNALYQLIVHPPEGGVGALRWQFVVGILLAAFGGCLVTLYKPPPGKAPNAVEHSVSTQNPGARLAD